MFYALRFPKGQFPGQEPYVLYCPTQKIGGVYRALQSFVKANTGE